MTDDLKISSKRAPFRLLGGGATGDLCRSIDWSAHPLGPADNWPAALKISLNLLFHSRHPMFIWWGPELYQFYNDGYLPSFGTGKHPQAMGQRGADCWPEIWPIIKPQIDAVMNNGESTWNEDQLVPIFRNGKIEDAYWTYGYSPIFNENSAICGTLVVCTETTKKINTQKLLEETAQKFKSAQSKVQLVLDTVPIFAGVLDIRGIVTLVNQIAVDAIEESKADVLGKEFWDCSWWKDLSEVTASLRQAVAQAAKGIAQRYDTPYTAMVKGLPYLRWVDLSMIPVIAENGEIESITTTGFDITDRILQAKELLAAKANAENANLTKSAFLANMSHEIRTPLGAILGFTDVLRNSSTELHERNDYLEIISRNGQALTKIIDDILDLSKIEAGKLEIENSSLCLIELARDVLAMFSDRAVGKGISLRLDESGFPKFKIHSDPIRIRQILVNLIGNAIKFTSQGGVTVGLDYKELKDDAVRVCFWVKDTGIGIDSEQATKLFTPFTQGDNKNSRRYGGTGLGLALSKKLGRILGGDVTLDSFELGKGCTFKLEILTYKSSSTRAGQARAEHYPDVKKRLRDTTVLVVDDSSDNRALIEIFLEREGAVVDQASDGEQAVEKALKKNYDVVLMDIQMPGIDGYQALAKLRRLNFQKPVLALTAHAMKEERNRALASGFSDHIPKPVDINHLVESIRLHTRRP